MSAIMPYAPARQPRAGSWWCTCWFRVSGRLKKAHLLAEAVEKQVREAIPNSNIVTHLEPFGDPISLEDADVSRG